MSKLVWMALQATIFVLFCLPAFDAKDPRDMAIGVIVAYGAAYAVTAAPLAFVDWCKEKLAARKARHGGATQERTDDSAGNPALGGGFARLPDDPGGFLGIGQQPPRNFL